MRLFSSDFSKGVAGWTPVAGKWSVVGEALQQSADGMKLRAYAGDSLWADYTYTLKAKKISGSEGFLIIFSVKDNDNYVWWNIGGWGNTKHAVQFSEDGWRVIVGKEAPGSIETGRWYDIKVELSGQRIRCYLDGQLVHDVVYENALLRSLHAVVGRDTTSGELVLKVVNVSKHAFDTQLDIRGTKSLVRTGSASILTSADPKDENSIELPRKVIPRSEQVNGISHSFRYTFPAYSLTVLRLRETK
jgi:alpha-L-arabinofuranosidase